MRAVFALAQASLVRNSRHGWVIAAWVPVTELQITIR
jgi:hypothetical protein